MAMASVICKASYAVKLLPLALRAVASPRILPPFVIEAAEHGSGRVHKKSFVTSHPTSVSSTVSDHARRLVDQKLVEALKSEMKSNPILNAIPEETFQVTEGLPFEMEDIPGELSVKLKRNFAGEKIEVLVYEPIFPTNWNSGGHDPSTDSDKPEKRCFAFDKPRIQLTFTVTKESGTTMSIYLWANVGYVGHPEIFIDPGSRVSNEMSYDKEEYWREFIRVRGIDDSIGKLMIDYMVTRYFRNCVRFLEKFSNFLEE